MIKFKHYDLWTTYNNDASNVSTDDICFITGAGVIRAKGTNFISPTTWGTSGQILKSNGSGSTPTWIDVPTYSNAVSEGASGLMTGADKKKVDNILNVLTTSSTTLTLTSNTSYSLSTTVSSLTITLGSPVADITNLYHIEFTTGSSVGTISFPNSVNWGDNEPEFESGKHYEISIKYCAGDSSYYGLWSAW